MDAGYGVELKLDVWRGFVVVVGVAVGEALGAFLEPHGSKNYPVDVPCRFFCPSVCKTDSKSGNKNVKLLLDEFVSS